MALEQNCLFLLSPSSLLRIDRFVALLFFCLPWSCETFKPVPSVSIFFVEHLPAPYSLPHSELWSVVPCLLAGCFLTRLLFKSTFIFHNLYLFVSFRSGCRHLLQVRRHCEYPASERRRISHTAYPSVFDNHLMHY